MAADAERIEETLSSGRPRVLVVGAGFGGLACARKLNRKPVEVLLVDERNYHLFTPLLYQVATALLNPSDIAYPLRRVFRGSPNVRVMQARVKSVDFKRKVVQVSPGSELRYDYLVLATGSANSYFGNQRLAEHSIGLKVLEEATRLRNHVLSCLERAEMETDDEVRQSLLTFLVAGGGPTGVEYAGALGELIQLVARRDFHSIAPSDVRIVLVEGRDRLLGMFPERLGRYAERVLKKRGIDVRTNTLVNAADDWSATLSDGSTIPTRTIVWSAGVSPEKPSGTEALAESRSKRIQVDDRLRIEGVRDAYAIGDVAAAKTDGDELPMLSPPAMQEGRYVARAILRDVQRAATPPEPFRYFDKGTMATIGRNAGIALVRGGLQFTGFFGWVTWIVVHVYYLIGFRNRLLALVAWGWNYLRFDRPIRIVLESQTDPLVEGIDDPAPPSQKARSRGGSG
ncbi:MAG: NAD(P)/FAD-dependent oxidoreductase [Candidatus Dormibacteraeota bacterium]|nr:NAD(P)/FAD-dependent oxidoreductase [Candidatus Dormibacteraeota bacterium]